MNRQTRLFLLAALVLTYLPANAAPVCEQVFAKSKTEPRFTKSSPVLPPRTARILGLIEEQAAIIEKAAPYVDPVAAENYLRYLRAYKSHVAASLPAGDPGAVSAEESRLLRQLGTMTAVADDLRAIPYPKAELDAKVHERQETSRRLSDIEKLWRDQARIERERRLALATKKNSRLDGKTLAGATRALNALEKEAASVRSALSAALKRMNLSEFEATVVQSFFSEKEMASIFAQITSGNTVHLNPSELAELGRARDKESGFPVYLSHLRARHEERLQREISTMLETYSAVAHGSYQSLFPWDRHSHGFQHHSDILDVDLRARLVRVESQLKTKTESLQADRQRVSALWAKRARIVGMIDAVETYLEGTASNLTSAQVKGEVVTRLGGLYHELQSVEDEISALFPLWGPKERSRLGHDPHLTESVLLAALDENISSLRAELQRLTVEREAWIARHQPNSAGGSDDDIELF